MTTSNNTAPVNVAHTITLIKLAQRQLQEDKMTKYASDLLASVNTRPLNVRGWHIELRTNQHPRGWARFQEYHGDAEYRYEMYLDVTFVARADAKPAEVHEFDAIVRTVATRCQQAGFGRMTLSLVDDEAYRPVNVENEDGTVTNDALGYAPVSIPDDWSTNFEHLYGLDAQIMMVRRAIEAGDMSEWVNRYNCVLVGPPGCGKSDVCRSVKRALGDDAVIEFDATATTAAGAIKELSEREILPRVIVIEEIEKADEKAMSFLLGVLDQRGEVRKTTARETVVRDTKMFAIATVNDVDLFEKLQAGALASRFANMIAFNRPSRELLAKILRREIQKIGGDMAWIDPTLDFCEEMGINDPRRVTAICLCGRELLLNGEYQNLLRQTSPKQGTEKKEL